MELQDLESKIKELTLLRDKIKDQMENDAMMKRIKEENERMINIIKEFGPIKVLEVPVVITGTDHDDGYCSGNDGEELEEEKGIIIVSLHYLVDYKKYNYSDFTDDKFDDDGLWKGTHLFSWCVKQCSSTGSGYCSCCMYYVQSGKVKWLKDYDYNKLKFDIVFPTNLKHVYKKYED
jgi:hypothetical protein